MQDKFNEPTTLALGAQSFYAIDSMDHVALNRRFAELDGLEELSNIRLGVWLAWPIVKMSLWRSAFQRLHANPDDTGGARRRPRLSFGALGLTSLLVNMVAPRRADLAVLYTPRCSSDGKGGTIHPHLGRFLQETPHILDCPYDWGRTIRRAVPRRGRLLARPVGFIVSILSRPWRLHATVRRASDRLAGGLGARVPMLTEAEIASICRGELARFLITFHIYRIVFRRAGIKRVLVMGAEGKTGEIAAAKSLGLPIIELQHGMFSRWEPDYAWGTTYRELKAAMPLPDRMLVFGPLWRRELLQNGFWKPSEISCVGNAVICVRRDVFRADRNMSGENGCMESDRSVNILFPTQHYVRDVAIAFWFDALRQQENVVDDAPLFRLLIALHPLEHDARQAYCRLVRRFPKTCTLLPNDIDGLDAIGQSCLVAGYTSFMLMEALGLGRPAVSLCGGAAAEGLAGSFDMPRLEEVIPHIRTPAALLDHVRRLRPAQDNDRGEPSASLSSGLNTDDVFFFPSDGFEKHLWNMITL